MATFILLSCAIVLVSKVNAEECSEDEQTCTDDLHCHSSYVVIEMPDIAVSMSDGGKYRRISEYSCTSEGYCQWAGMDTEDCIHFSVADKTVESYAEVNGVCVGPIEAPVTINQTVSCCHNDMDCASVFNHIHTNDTIYRLQNCDERNEITPIVEDVVDCYGTDEYMRYTSCNKTEYDGVCPLFFFEHLKDYAKCSCQALNEWDNTSTGYADSFMYFSELTVTVEAIFARFRGNKDVECPDWQFSCNADGEALLNVFEIVCPLQLGNISDADIDTITARVTETVGNGTNTLTDEQVEIFGDYIRVLMYSEEEAVAAMEWLESDEVPDEIATVASACTMNETMWNLNELYGDYVPPEEQSNDASVDDHSAAGTIQFWIAFGSVLAIFSML